MRQVKNYMAVSSQNSNNTSTEVTTNVAREIGTFNGNTLYEIILSWTLVNGGSLDVSSYGIEGSKVLDISGVVYQPDSDGNRAFSINCWVNSSYYNLCYVADTKINYTGGYGGLSALIKIQYYV